MNKKISAEFAIVVIILVAIIFGLLIWMNNQKNEKNSSSFENLSNSFLFGSDTKKEKEIPNNSMGINEDVAKIDKNNQNKEKKYDVIDDGNGSLKLKICGKEISVVSIADLEDDSSIVYFTKNKTLNYAKLACPFQEQRIADLKNFDIDKFDFYYFFNNSSLVKVKNYYIFGYFANGPGDLKDVFIFHPQSMDYILALQRTEPNFDRGINRNTVLITSSKSKKPYYYEGNDYENGSIYDYFLDNNDKNKFSKETEEIINKYLNYFPNKIPVFYNYGDGSYKDGYFDLNNNKFIKK